MEVANHIKNLSYAYYFVSQPNRKIPDLWLEQWQHAAEDTFIPLQTGWVFMFSSSANELTVYCVAHRRLVKLSVILKNTW